MSLRDDLIAAKALIDTPEKWGKGNWTYLRNCGPACAHEALRRLRPLDADHQRLRRYLRRALPPGCQHETVPDFNDDPATTHADVMALFDRAIAAASPTPSIDMSKQGAKQ